MLPPPAVGLMDPLGGDPHPFVHPEKGSSVQTNRPRSHALDGPPAVPATSGSLSPHLCGCSDSMSRSAWRTRLRIAGAKHSNSRASSPAVRPGRTSSTIWRRYEDLVERNLSTTLRQRRFRFTEQAVVSWSRPAG